MFFLKENYVFAALEHFFLFKFSLRIKSQHLPLYLIHIEYFRLLHRHSYCCITNTLNSKNIRFGLPGSSPGRACAWCTKSLLQQPRVWFWPAVSSLSLSPQVLHTQAINESNLAAGKSSVFCGGNAITPFMIRVKTRVHNKLMSRRHGLLGHLNKNEKTLLMFFSNTGAFPALTQQMCLLWKQVRSLKITMTVNESDL